MFKRFASFGRGCALAVCLMEASAAARAQSAERFPNNGTEPGYSHDGTRIAFGVSEGNQRSLWTMNADGRHAKKLIPAADSQHYLRWSPDDTRLVFVKQADKACEYISIKPDGSDRRPFLPDAAPKPELVPIEWSPDGKCVAYSSKPAPDKRSQIVIVEAATGRVVRWLEGERTHGPRFAPDGRHLLFTGSQRIWIGDAQGENAKAIVEGTFANFPADPAWSSDGSRIYYSMVNQQTGELWSCRPDGSDVKQVYSSPLRFFYPTPAPKADGILLAVRQTDDWDLWLYSIDTSGKSLTKLIGQDSGPPIFEFLGDYTMSGKSWTKAGDEPQATSGKSSWTRALAGEVIRENWMFQTDRRPFSGELSITRTAPNRYEATQLNEWNGEQAHFTGLWDAAAGTLTFDRVIPDGSTREAIRWVYRFGTDGTFAKEAFIRDAGAGDLRKQSEAKYTKSGD